MTSDDSSGGQSMERALDSAEQRLNNALKTLEAAIHKQIMRDRASAGLRAEAHALAEDRARLAADFDRMKHKAEQLEQANRQVLSRIDGAMIAIRDVLDRDEGGAGQWPK